MVRSPYAASLLAVVLVACTTPAKTEAETKTASEPAAGPERQTAPIDAGDTGGPSPHGGPANPHASSSPPHGVTPPFAGASASAPKGPPRDVTPSGKTHEQALAELTIAVPEEWTSTPTTSSMRVAQWALPGPGGDAELVVYRFADGAGTVEANIARWKGQFTPPEGKTIDDVTVTKTLDAGELKITLLDVRGRYVAQVQPGATSTHDEPDYRMLTAIVQGSGDPFYFKLLGPEATLGVWAEAYEALLTTAKTSA